LGFKAGDVLTVTHQDDSEWWYAITGNDRRSGFIPHSFVELLTPEECEEFGG